MSILGKKWVLKSDEKDKSILEILLKNRGLKSPTENEIFHDPMLMKDMSKSVEKISTAIKNKERIMIFGDYDVDGLASAAILFHALRKLGANHSVRLPNREKDGYGLSEKFIDEFENLGVKLVITVDCGISCSNEVLYAKSKGIDVIITDHHSIPEQMPESAYSINHPKRKDCEYPFKELTGAGVALKVAYALMQHELGEEEAENQLGDLYELAMLGTIADLGVVQGENKLIIKKGLEKIADTRRPGIKILKELAKLNKEITVQSIGYQIAPRINAAGRIGDPYIALKLLIGEENSNEEILYRYGLELEETNQRRQKMTTEGFEEAIGDFKELREKNKLPYIIIAENPSWHVGIIGLLASKLAEEFNRPAIIMQDLGSVLVGSARSIEAFNIVEAIGEAGKFLVTYGGHKEAAGFTVKKENLSEFKRILESHAKMKLENSDLRPTLAIDCELQSNQITEDLISEIWKLKPFGVRNSRPIFLLRNVKPLFISTVGRNSDHVKFEAETDSKTVSAIGFRMGKFASLLKESNKIDIACHVDLNTWKDSKKLQLELVDFKV